jgi:tetratricopeptide (TPR) repeat protein
MKIWLLAGALVIGCAPFVEAPPPAEPARAGADGPFAEGQAALHAKDWARAREIFREATSRDAKNAGAWAGLGMAEQGLDHLREAADAYTRSLDIEDSPQARHNLGMVLARSGRVDLGREQLQRAVALDPKYFLGWRELAQADLELGDLGEAATALGVARRLSPEDAHLAELTRELQSALAGQGIPAEAMLHFSRGTAHAAQGKDDAAQTEYDAALRIAPHFGDCHYNLGVLVRRAGDLDRAEREYRAALADYPPNAKTLRADAQNNLADLLVARGKAPAEAESLVREAIATRGERASYLDTLARACDAGGKRDCAREAFGKLLDPGKSLPPEVRRHAEERLRALK